VSATRVYPLEAIRQRGRGMISGATRFGMAQGLVAFQVALAFVLVWGAALLVHSFVSMTSQDLGFDRRNVIVAVPDFSRSQVARRERVPVADRIRERVRGVAGVRDVGLVESSPFGFGTGLVAFAIGGDEPGDRRVELNRVSDGYFRTMGAAIVAGRDFEALTREPRQSAIVNQAFAARYLAGQPAIGQTLRLGVRNHPRVEIVGVAADARHTSLRDAIAPTVFEPMLPEDVPWIEIDISSDLPEPDLRADPSAVSQTREVQETVQRAIQALSPDHQMVVTLHHLEGMPVEEIAKIMKCSVGTVKSRLSRARDNLRRKLAGFVEG
jgi:RNA polymerase sigma factor (sigma-70 family)